MDKITCPICTRLNDPSENRCWFCSAELHPDAPTLGSNDDGLSRMNEDHDAGSSIQNDEYLKNIEVVSPSEDIPDWLARIRAREAAERAQQKSEEDLLKVQKKSKGGIPDWLSSISEGIELSAPLKESLPEDPGKEELEQIPLAPENEISLPPEGESDWLESLKSWQSVNVQENLTRNEGVTTTIKDEISEPSLDDNDRDIDLEKLKSPATNMDLPVVGESEENSMGEDDRENEVSSWFKTVEDIGKLNQSEFVEPSNGNNAEIYDSDTLISPEWESKDQISQVFEELQSHVVPEEIVSQNLSGDIIVQEGIEPAPSVDAFEGKDSTGEVLSIEPMVNSGDEESVTDSLLPLQTIVPGDEIEEADSSKPFKPDELPDWLNEKQTIGETKLEPEPELKPAKVKLVSESKLPKPEKANLPVWLEAMRPIDAVELPAIPSEPTSGGKSDEILEEPDVISGGKIPQAIRKPSDLGGGLKVTERHKTNALLLSTMAANFEGTIE